MAKNQLEEVIQMTFWILLVIAGWLTYYSLKYNHLLLSLGASIAWLTLMGYNLNFPPTNVVVGSTIHEWMTYVFVIVAIAIGFAWFRGRGRTESTTRVGLGKEEIIAQTTTKTGVTGKNLMNQSEEEYRASVRRSLHPSRRRR
jgi:hypothetical protein